MCARWALLGNELRLVGGLVVDRLKTGAGHCNDEFAVPDVNHNTVEMRSQGQSFWCGPQMTILSVLKESPAKRRAKTDFKARLPGLLAIPVVNVLLDLILGEPITLLDLSF